MDKFYNLINQHPELRKSFLPDPEVVDFAKSLIKGEFVEHIDVRKLQQTSAISINVQTRSIIGMVTPTLEWARLIKEVVGDGTVLEVGSGTGLVAKYLNHVRVNIIATDNMSYHKHECPDWKMYFDVIEMDFKDAINQFRADYLLLSWPLYEKPLATEAAKLYTKLNPDGIIIYIGEWRGATADKEFHDGIEIVRQIDNSLYPQWSGVKDRVFIVKWVNK